VFVTAYEVFVRRDGLEHWTYVHRAGQDFWVGANHCDATTQPYGDSGCVAYDGCDEGHPVIWCLFDGGHVVPPFAASEIWSFFSQF
jgi:poly(3-hydroxybutyrate) depolymerase